MALLVKIIHSVTISLMEELFSFYKITPTNCVTMEKVDLLDDGLPNLSVEVYWSSVNDETDFRITC